MRLGRPGRADQFERHKHSDHKSPYGLRLCDHDASGKTIGQPFFDWGTVEGQGSELLRQ